MAAKSPTLKERCISDLKDLKESEVCIDGVIYDLTNFDHPGGDSLKTFCGNDCTVLYKMIHPHHSSDLHTKKLERVGKVEGYSCEYEFESEFAKEMKQEVSKIVRRGKEFATLGFFLRAFFYISLYFYLSFLWIVQGPSTTLAIALGVSFALIGLNVQHDANHGAVSRNFWINELLGLGSDCIGRSKWIWAQQHWTHHAYTNDPEKDPDTSSSEPIILFHNYPNDHPVRSWYHPYQLFLFLPAISAYWLSSIIDIDVVKLAHSSSVQKGMNFENEFNRRRRVWAMFSRVLHVAVVFGPPLYHQGLCWAVVRDLYLVGASGSLVLGCLFSLSHNFEGAERDPLKEKGTKKVDWYKSQVETSCTYGGFLSGALTGGLNFQIEHHLFPRMSSAWYPFIAPTVRRVCAKHGVRYTYYPWIHQNILSLARTLHRAGNGKDSKQLVPGVDRAVFVAITGAVTLASWAIMQPSTEEPTVLMLNKSLWF